MLRTLLARRLGRKPGDADANCVCVIESPLDCLWSYSILTKHTTYHSRWRHPCSSARDGDRGSRPHRMFRMELQVVARSFLSARAPVEPMAGVLCRAVRHCRDQQHVLSIARAVDFRELAPANAARFPGRGQRQPVPDAHETSMRSGRAIDAIVLARRCTRSETGTGAVPTARPLHMRLPSARALSTRLAAVMA